ncbi:adhesin Lsa14 [Leptospira sp. GIMC2001]|uniref:adhesin Lsa14 n=1 Tax=Leptospira sp. GIMC2001 TaxID=1513297 RepID=UPI00234A0D09|nr:TRL-like family protein [Leptospira sp. GIMC2001]WCL51108.1 TRL-like family protein [Leptospira sp. GIMC2001]
MNLKLRLILLIQTSLIFLTWNCTGLNVATTFGVGAVTNPAREYVNPGFIADKGGLLFHNNTVAGQISSNAEPNAIGKSCSNAVLWLFAWGDSSIEAGKKAAGITRVSSVEYEQLAILGMFYHRFCIKVNGSSEAGSSELTKTVQPTTSVKKGR